MPLNRRAFIKAQAAASAAAVAGITLPASASNLITTAEQSKLTWSKAACRFCGTGCSIYVATRDNHVVATHGDIKSPVNKGLACIKGYFLSKIMYGEDRLTQPLLRKSNGKYDKNGEFTPVTDAMLENPAPGDWLMWRRTQDGWGYSPLEQINKRNVGQLRMVWTRALNAGSQTGTPLAYNGVMYMPNPNDVIQALDGATRLEWRLQDLRALVAEPFEPPPGLLARQLRLAVSRAPKREGTDGTEVMSTWDDVANWYRRLTAGRSVSRDKAEFLALDPSPIAHRGVSYGNDAEGPTGVQIHAGLRHVLHE